MAFIRGDLFSQSLQMQTSFCAVLPDGKPAAQAPVVYLLHGLTDNCTGWQRYTGAERYAKQYGAVLVMPEVQRSFYTDMSAGPAYFTYVSCELPQLCTQLFGWNSSPADTYVMGLSMGGYGAIKCAMTYPERYAGCAAFSAVADIRSAMASDRFRKGHEAELDAIFGASGITKKEDLFVLGSCCAEQKRCVPLYMACGAQDALYEDNVRLREALGRLNWPLVWESWDGGHSWDFWDEALRRALRHFLG